MSDDTSRAQRQPRPLPMCPESESAIIVAILAQHMNPDLAVDELDPSDFMDSENRIAWKGIVELHRAGLPTDVPGLKDWIVRNGHSGTISPNNMQHKLGVVPYVSDMQKHVQMVKKHARLRNLILACKNIEIQGYDAGDNIEEFIESAESEIYKASVDRSSGKVIHHLRDCVHDMFSAIQKELEDRLAGRVTSVCTGLTRLDAMIGGLRNGELVVIPARPSMGKTAFMLNIATHVAQLDATPRLGAHVISLESPRENVTARVVAAEGNVDVERIRQRQFSPDDWSSLTPACQRAGKLPITIDERKGLTISQIRGSIRRAQAELRKSDAAGNITQKLGIVCVDYLQLIRNQVRSGSREEAVSQIAYELLTMAGDFDVPVVALSQLNRDCEKRDDKRPRMSDIRESGAIEQAANIIVALYRDDYYDKKSADAGLAEAIVLKSKDTRTGTVKVKFTPAWMRFDNLEEREPTDRPMGNSEPHWQERDSGE